MESKLNITESGGSWVTYAKARHDPCVGMKTPISIESSSADAITIKLQASQALGGCPDSTVELKRVDDKTMKGKLGNIDLTLSRE